VHRLSDAVILERRRITADSREHDDERMLGGGPGRGTITVAIGAL